MSSEKKMHICQQFYMLQGKEENHCSEADFKQEGQTEWE